jgi:endoglucanase
MLLCACASPDGQRVDNSPSTTLKQPIIEITEPPSPPDATENPFSTGKLFVDPESLAMLTANSLRETDPSKAEILDEIAKQPMALWMGNWNSDIYRSVDHFVGRAESAGAVAVMIAYNIPLRDCGGESAGGLSTVRQYREWIRRVHAGIADRPAVVIVEPDALGHFQECLSPAQKSDRMMLLADAVKVLRQSPTTAVYLDAGHARWVEAPEMAERLKNAGIEYANGFALNVSNYVATEENLEYGRQLSALVGDKPFVIDTSRNGAGPFEEATSVKDSWCNPPGRKIGAEPTTDTADPACHAYLWLKRPGESDGQCGGGPVAGSFWLERALEMASR